MISYSLLLEDHINAFDQALDAQRFHEYKLLTPRGVIALECLKVKCGECPRHDCTAAVGAKRHSTGLAATRVQLAEVADRHRPQPPASFCTTPICHIRKTWLSNMFDHLADEDAHRDAILRLLRVAGFLEERNIATGPSQNRSTMLHLHAAEHSHCRQRADDASVGTRLRAKLTCMIHAMN
jgi:hypothetical protein